MELSIRPAIYTLPSYSLTGDLVGFMRCGLQYRYTTIGQLPSTRPVQAWFGQFIHGVLEEAYRRYRTTKETGKNDLPPWPTYRIEEIRKLIQKRLSAQGLAPRDAEIEKIGNDRAEVIVNQLGPDLFPLIHKAEVRITGARALPANQIPAQYWFREADRYEMVGIIDVVTHLQLADPSLQSNQLVQMILGALPQKPPKEFEIIVDYKGMRRPPVKLASTSGPSFWEIYGWQLQTYGHLRATHSDRLPIVAGVVVYLNELLPARRDLVVLKKEIAAKMTDILPETGGEAEEILKAWREKDKDLPDLPWEFRLKRALRIVPITPQTIQESLVKFDNVVARIETCRGKELKAGKILTTWETNSLDEDTCKACDARTFCPSYKKETMPSLPAVSV